MGVRGPQFSKYIAQSFINGRWSWYPRMQLSSIFFTWTRCLFANWSPLWTCFFHEWACSPHDGLHSTLSIVILSEWSKYFQQTSNHFWDDIHIISRLMRIWLIVPVMCSVLSCFYLYDSIATRSVISISGHIFCNKAFIAVHYYLVQQLCLSILFFGMQFSCIGFDYSDICTAFETWKVIHFSAVSCVSISLRCLPCLLCLHHTVLWIEVSHLFSCSHSFVHFYLFLSLDSSTLVHLHCCWWQS